MSVAPTAGAASATKDKGKDKKNLVSVCHYTGEVHGPPYEGVPVIVQIEVEKKDVPAHLAHGDFLYQPGPGSECQFGA